MGYRPSSSLKKDSVTAILLEIVVTSNHVFTLIRKIRKEYSWILTCCLISSLCLPLIVGGKSERGAWGMIIYSKKQSPVQKIMTCSKLAIYTLQLFIKYVDTFSPIGIVSFSISESTRSSIKDSLVVALENWKKSYWTGSLILLGFINLCQIFCER